MRIIDCGGRGQGKWAWGMRIKESTDHSDCFAIFIAFITSSKVRSPGFKSQFHHLLDVSYPLCLNFLLKGVDNNSICVIRLLSGLKELYVKHWHTVSPLNVCYVVVFILLLTLHLKGK